MTTRDEYVTNLKSQLDHWNEDMAKWERQAKEARAEARQRYEKDLAALKAQREKAMYQLKLLQGASATAWTEVARGADEAWNAFRKSLDTARTQFEKK